MPAAVTRIHAGVGDLIEAGERLVTLEVMKMEMPVLAPVSGRVSAVLVTAASQVAAGDVLVELEADSSGAASDVEPVALPSREESEADIDDTIFAALTGFDPTDAEVERAIAALRDTDRRVDVGRLLEAVRAYVVQEQLFQTGAYDDARNDARESSAEQLLWFIRHGTLDEEVLSARYIRRLHRFLDLHGLADATDEDAVQDALVRLFQARKSPARLGDLLLAIFGALSREESAGMSSLDEARGRVIFEKLANAAIERKQVHLASAAWTLIYRWYDLPREQAEAARHADEVARAFAAYVDTSGSSEARAEARSVLDAASMAAILAAAQGAPTDHLAGKAALHVLAERLSDARDVEPLGPDGAALASCRLWDRGGRPTRVVVLGSAELIGSSACMLDEDERLIAVLLSLPSRDVLDEIPGVLSGTDTRARHARVAGG